MKKLAKSVALMACLVGVLALAACGSDDESSAEQAEQAGPPDCAQGCTIGISVPEAQNPFYVGFSEVMTEELEADGHDVRVVSANSSIPEQIDGINDLVAAEVDLLLVSPLDENGPIPAFRAAQRAGIPVITYLRKLEDEFQRELALGFVGYFLEESGRMKGKWLDQHSQPGPVAMLLGPAGASFANEQEKGFRDTVEPKGFEVVFAQSSDQSREAGVALAEDALTAHPDITALYASNDDMALGASKAVQTAGRLDEVAILGLNGSPPALEAVKNGQMAMTVALDPVGGGTRVVEVVSRYLETGKIPESTPLDQVVVDESNVDEFLE